MSAPGRSKYVPESFELEDTFDAPSTYPKNTPGIPQVRTLKPPPEIWELVHPVAPRKRTPTMAFVNRITSNGTTLMILILAALALGGVSAFLIVRPDKLEAKTNPNAKTPAVQQARPTRPGVASSASATVPENPPASEATIGIQPSTTVTANAVEEIPTLASPKRTRPVKKPVPVSQEVVAERVSAERAESRPVVESNSERKSSLDSSIAKPKANASVSPQVVAPAKPTESPKAKVIPWP
jgi:hypothetical protein